MKTAITLATITAAVYLGASSAASCLGQDILALGLATFGALVGYAALGCWREMR